tara:strand:+ start:420 stop:1817 length:1398 start_codon:yes stop_codon:yes gene_type:complete
MKNDLNKKINNLMISAQSSKEQGDLPSTLNYLNEILKLDTNNKRALNNIGNAYKEMKNFDEAVKYYSKAINSDPNYKIAKINLSILYHDLGNLDKAEKLYKDLIINDKHNFAILFNLSRINFSFFNEDRINFIESSINNENISNYNKASGYFILAKNEQIKKNFDKEIEFLEKGHKYFCKSIPPKVYDQSLNYWLNIIPKKFHKIEITNTKKIDKKNIDINPIFIIGMPRSGSTLVESIISSGKSLIPNGGETAGVNWAMMKNYRKVLFDDNLGKIIVDGNELRNDILSKYQNLNLLNLKKGNFFTDKSLENFFYIDIILKLFPNAKFIHCKRNKIDNIFAIYQNFLTKMPWTHSLKDIIVYFDNYLNVMDYFKKKFKHKIFSIELEKLTINSKKISQKMFEFCGLEWSDKSLEYYKRKDLFSTTASNQQIREKIYKYNNAKYEVYKKHIKEFEQEYDWLKKELL